MVADNSSVIANGAVGMTGLTRAVAVLGSTATSTSVIFTLPNTFILKGYLPTVIKADGSGAVNITAMSISNGQCTATLSAAAGVGAEIYLFGILGRRDDGLRSTSNPYAENPNMAGRP